MTFAFSTLIGVILYLWWDKPFNVRCSAPVHLVEVATEQVTSDTFPEDDLFPENRCLCYLLPLDALSTALEGEAATGDQIGTNNPFASSPTGFRSISPPLQDNSNFNSVPTTTEDLLSSSQTDSSRGSTPSVSRMKRFYFPIQHSSQKRGSRICIPGPTAPFRSRLSFQRHDARLRL